MFEIRACVYSWAYVSIRLLPAAKLVIPIYRGFWTITILIFPRDITIFFEIHDYFTYIIEINTAIMIMVVKDYYDINIWITTTMPDINGYDIND